MKDYSIVTTQTLAGPRGKIDERFEAQVDLELRSEQVGARTNWSQFRDGERKPTELLPTEELNSQKLNDLKTALGDMKIVGVLRKPTGLGADLKAGADFMNNEESQTSLMNRGFYLVDIGGGDPEIRAANGEVLVGLKDGVEYVLRFGEIASVRGTRRTGRQDQPLPVRHRAAGRVQVPAAAARAAPGRRRQPPRPPPRRRNRQGRQPGPPRRAAKTEEAARKKRKKEKTDLELERERIRKENQRKQDERDEKLKKANTQVAELNARFADWYYIISEDEYKKVHLGRNDLIAEKSSAAAEGFGVDALRQLEKDGIQKETGDSAKCRRRPRHALRRARRRSRCSDRRVIDSAGSRRTLDQYHWYAYSWNRCSVASRLPASRYAARRVGQARVVAATPAGRRSDTTSSLRPTACARALRPAPAPRPDRRHTPSRTIASSQCVKGGKHNTPSALIGCTLICTDGAESPARMRRTLYWTTNDVHRASRCRDRRQSRRSRDGDAAATGNPDCGRSSRAPAGIRSARPRCRRCPPSASASCR